MTELTEMQQARADFLRGEGTLTLAQVSVWATEHGVGYPVCPDDMTGDEPLMVAVAPQP